jgi:hypothetical protein
MSDIVLSAALRSNLLSLQNTQRLIDSTQQRLATGLKINSALDGAQAFFASQSLNNRASDLGRLLDGIGQSIRTIEQANNGVSGLTRLINQADSITSQALDALNEAAGSATATGVVDLSGITDLTSLTDISDGDTFTVQVGDGAVNTVTISQGQGINALLADLNDIQNVAAELTQDGTLQISSTNGEALRIANGVNADDLGVSNALTSANGLGFTSTDDAVSSFAIDLGSTGAVLTDDLGAEAGSNFVDTSSFEVSVGGRAAVTITVDDTETVQDFLDELNAIEGLAATYAADTVTLRALNGETIELTDGNTTPLALSAADTGDALNANGFEVDPRQDGTYIVPGNVLSQTLVNDSTGATADWTDALNTLRGFTTLENGDTITINIGNGNFTTINADATIAEIVSSINDDANNGTGTGAITASFDNSNGVLQIGIGSAVEELSITYAVSDASTESFGFEFGNGIVADGGAASFTQRFAPSDSSSATSRLSELQADYNRVRTQIDQLVADSGYAGSNLLNGDDLVTYFNENRTSSLTIEGVDFTSSGLGLTAANFSDIDSINVSIEQVSAALSTLRGFGSSLTNNLTIIQNRQDFTSQTINTLKAGSDDLTLADQNEEGANLLALQTRQQLGVTALSLAAQSQQSVLRLF